MPSVNRLLEQILQATTSTGVSNDLLYHDTVNNRLVSTIPFETTLNSLYLRDQSRLSSAGVDISIENIDRKDRSFPTFTVLKDHDLPINRTSAGVVRSSAPDFGGIVDDGSGGFEPRGGAASSGEVDFILDTTLAQSLSIFEILVISEEDIEPADTLYYAIYSGTSSSDRKIEEQEITNITVSKGGDLTWGFDGFSNLLSGDQLHIEMLIDKGTQGNGTRPLKVRPSASQSTEIYAKLLGREYSRKIVAYKDELDALISGAEYKGAWDVANNPTALDGLTPSLGDTYRVSVAGTHNLGFGSTDFKVGDFVVWNGTGWDYYPLNIATIAEIEGAALSEYDITVDSDYTGSEETGSSLRPFKTIAQAISNAVDGSTILVKGGHLNLTGELTLPNSKSLSFYFQNGAAVGYATYSSTNGSVFYVDALNNTKTYKFYNAIIKNAGGYGVRIKNAKQVDLVDCEFTYNGWNGSALNTILPSGTSGLLGFDSSQADLQAFYSGANASNGGAVRLENVTNVNAINNDATKNLRSLRFEDCGIGGYGFVTRNVTTQNIDSGIYLASSTYNATNGCENFTVFNNASSYNANNGILSVGGINNVISLNAIRGNWNAGVMGWHCSNTRFRNLDLSDNNRSAFNGIGNNGDAHSSVTIGGNTARADRDYIADILSVEVYNTGLGSNTSKIGLQILQDVEQITDDYDKSLINIDNSGFVNQDYSIDALCDGDIVKITLGDNRYIGTEKRNLSIATGHYYELPYSNHITNLKECDISIEGDSVILREGIGGVRLNPYTIYDLRADLNGTDIKIVLRDSEKIQFNVAIGGISIDGVLLTGTNQEKVNEINALLQHTGSSSGQPPSITSSLAVTLQAGTTLNYELTADFAIAYEWDFSNVPGITNIDGNIRKLIGGSNLAVGTYNIPVKAFNYDNTVGVDSETLVLTVSTPPFNNTKSINFANGDYLGANASLLNSTLGRAGNGSGSSDAWTISMWFKPSTNTSGQTIFYFGDNDITNAGHLQLRFLGGNDNLRFQYGSNNNHLRFQSANNSLTPGQWHHIMVSYDGGTTGASSNSMSSYYGRFDVFIDGASVVSAGTWSHSNFGYTGGIDPDNLRVGRYASGNYLKDCRVDELAIWNSDRSSNIADIYNSGVVKNLDSLTVKPKHWWRMGDGDNYPNIQDHGTEANCVFVMYNMTAADIVSDVP